MKEIKVDRPVFNIDMDNPEQVYYESADRLKGKRIKTIHVADWLHGFPPLKDNQILYIYKPGRGAIINTEKLKEKSIFKIDPNKFLWEVLVPATKGKDHITYEHHKEWDEFVKSLSGGLTILKTGKGYWYNPEGKEYEDRIIPVRIYCDEDTIHKIIDFTISHYAEEAVMCYKVSDHVILKHKKDIII